MVGGVLFMSNILTIGLGFGDEGKGSFIDYLSVKNPKINTYIKYNGGCQARHTVDYGINGTFSFAQLSPALVRNKEAKLYLYCNYVINFQNLVHECEEYSKRFNCSVQDILRRVYIDMSCLCVTPFHKIYNCLIEEKEGIRGSTGMGVSIANLWSEEQCGDLDICADDFYTPKIVQKQLEKQKEYLKELLLEKDISYPLEEIDYIRYLSDMEGLFEKYSFNIGNYRQKIRDTEPKVFESSQGFLLDKKYGFKPNITFLDTSMDSLKNINGNRIGFIRSLYTRHGQGIFPTEDNELNQMFEDKSQEVGKYNGSIRFGWFDCVLYRYALTSCAISSVYMSHMDYFKNLKSVKISIGYKLHESVKDISDWERIFEIESVDGLYVIKNIKRSVKSITNYLNGVVPIYREITFKSDILAEKIKEYVAEIEKESGVKISVCSYGSNVLDKLEV